MQVFFVFIKLIIYHKKSTKATFIDEDIIVL